MYFDRGIRAMTDVEIQKKAPAVFADQPHSKTTYFDENPRYLFLPTINLVDGLRKVGWEVVAAKQMGNSKTSAENKATNKHALFFARTENLARGANYGDTLPLVKLENAHNGSSAFGLATGFFRLACSNGLTIPESIYSAPRVRHHRDMIEEAQEATLTVLRDFPKLIEMKETMAQIELTNQEKEIFADIAADAFFEKSERDLVNEVLKKRQGWNLPRGFGRIEQQLVRPVRSSDTKNDLWTVSNVIQERLIRGGVQVANEAGDIRYQRKVTSIDRDKDIHNKLFLLTQRMAELKGVKIGLTA